MSFFNDLKKKDEYYYDFGTGNKVKREDSNKTDDFLIGFNSVTNTPIAKTLRYEPKEEIKPRPVSYSSNTSYRAPQLNTKQSYTPSTAHLGGDIKTDEDKNLFYNAFEAENRVQQNKPQKSRNPDAIEFGEDSETYKILQDLGNRWYATSDSAEKDRLHGVAEDVRRYHREGTPIVDRHDQIMNLLHENAKTAQNYQKTMTEGFPGFLYRMSDGNYMLDSSTYLIGMVDEGEWDYKYNDDWRVKYDYFDGKDMDTPKSNYRNWTPWMYFDGHLIAADKLGNMNMAYVGNKMGLPEWVYKNFETTDKDDPYWVQYGIDLAKSGR